MSDWELRLVVWERRLGRWNEDYERELGRRLREARRFLRRPSPDRVAAAEADARRAAGEQTLVELFALFDELAGDYLAAELPQERAKLRAWIGAEPLLFRALWSYVEQAPELIRGPADERRLELALAAVSLDDGRVDARQRDAALGRLYLAAARAGIDPRPAFQKVAARSNPGTGGGGAHTRAVLEGFPRSFYFEREVRPRLAPSRAQ
jgi:hypothetical protein